MLSFKEQDFLFWRLVYELVSRRGYRVLKLNEKGEVWLEFIKGRDSKLIRLVRHDIDWGNWLLSDIKSASKKIKQVKKQYYRNKMKAYNIYVSTYPPVDDWEHLIEKNATEPLLIEIGNREEALQKLFDSLHLPKLDFKNWWIGNEDELNFIIQSIRDIENRREQEEKNLLFAKKPFLTYIFASINLIMFLLLELFGSSTNTLTLIKFGAKYNPAILDGEWWRFFTPIFLHIGFLHLFMNTAALYYLGLAVERIYGSFRFLFIYLIAGIAGVVASFAFTTNISAGASGAIFGLFGGLLYFGVVHRSLFFRTMGSNVLGLIAINLVFGFVVPIVDNSAHIGGLIGGFLASAFVHLPKHKPLIRQLMAFLILVIMIGSVLAYGFFYSDQAKDPIVVGQVAQELIEKDEIDEANSILTALVQEQTDSPPEVYFLLSYTEIKLGNLEKAVTHLEYVVQEKSEFHEAFYNLALVYFELGDYDKARSSIEKAIQLQPNDEDYKMLYQQLE